MILEKNSSFFYTCKENYFLNILPADPQSQKKAGYKALVDIAVTYFSAGLYEPIIQYLNESRYLIQLWSAYLTLEYGEPGEVLKADCIKILKLALEPSTGQFSEEQEQLFRKYITQI